MYYGSAPILRSYFFDSLFDSDPESSQSHWSLMQNLLYRRCFFFVYTIPQALTAASLVVAQVYLYKPKPALETEFRREFGRFNHRQGCSALSSFLALIFFLRCLCSMYDPQDIWHSESHHNFDNLPSNNCMYCYGRFQARNSKP